MEKCKALNFELSDQIINAINSVIGFDPAELHEPSFNGNEWVYVKECIDSTFVSSIGKYVDKFEYELKDFTGAKYVIAVVNGTAALHIALKLAGVETGDEVLVPALTFIATANAVSYCNAIPHFVDSEDVTLGMDPFKLRCYLIENTEQRSGNCVNRKSGRVIRAMVPMHTFGHPSNLEKLLSIAHDFNIKLIEDSAESLGSYYYGKHTGTFGLFGILSFNGNKIITTGGGGAILTNDINLAKYAKHLTTTAKLPHSWDFIHNQVGYNYRLPNLNAALGCGQLEMLANKLAKKRKLFELYDKSFKNISDIKLFSEPKGCKSNYWLQTIVLDSNAKKSFDDILINTNKVGIKTRPIWKPIHKQEMYVNMPRMDLTVAESLSKLLINIPSSPSLVYSDDD